MLGSLPPWWTRPRTRPEPCFLRKDYVYLFERYFYFLESLPVRERGLIVFDELDKAQSAHSAAPNGDLFLGHGHQSMPEFAVVPEPFFVHSDLTTGVFLADLTAYILGWAWRLRRMSQPRRDELRPLPRNSATCSSLARSQDPAERERGSSTESRTSMICEGNSTGIRRRNEQKNKGNGWPRRTNQSLR